MKIPAMQYTHVITKYENEIQSNKMKQKKLMENNLIWSIYIKAETSFLGRNSYSAVTVHQAY